MRPPSARSYTAEEREQVFKAFPVCRTYWTLTEMEPKDLSQSLRLEKARDFLDVAFATYWEKVQTADLCFFWSLTSEERLKRAFDEAFEGDTNGWGAFAYGKLGSQELNLSSDVDLVFLGEKEPDRKRLARLRRFHSLIADHTDFGFCHRLDFDLRAGGRQGPLIATFEQWQDYFANFGEAWERLTFIRFRPIWGDSRFHKKVTGAAARFTFRRYLDFSLIDELKSLRRRIHEQNWIADPDAIDLKLGAGGIRDLELFIHTLQVIYGGKSERVRARSTNQAFDELHAAKALSAADRDFLRRHYWKLRHLENSVQAAGDEQTHLLPARKAGDLIRSLPVEELRADMERCDQLVSDLLGPLDHLERSLPESPAAREAWLSSLGADPARAMPALKSLYQIEIFSRQRDKDDRMRKLFVFRVLSRAHELGLDVELTLSRLVEFVRKIRAKATLFHLLVNRPQIIDRLCYLLSGSDYLSQVLTHRPELLDSFVMERQVELSAKAGTEEKIAHWKDRRWLTELLAGLDFIGNANLGKLTERVTSTADQIVVNLLSDLKREFSSNADVLALGKWGGGELGLGSDLDFILVTPGEPSEDDFRMGRRLINRLTGGDSIYRVDLRLNPHGGSGLFLTAFPDLLEFLKTEAPVWQRLCYLKSRSLTGAVDVMKIGQASVHRPLQDEDLDEIRRIRNELIKQNYSGNPLQVKYAPGGLLQIELFAQKLLLHNQQPPEGPGTGTHLNQLKRREPREERRSSWTELAQGYQILRTVEQFMKVRQDQVMLARALGVQITEVKQCVSDHLHKNMALMAVLDPRSADG